MNIPRKYKIWRYPLGCRIHYGLKSLFYKPFLSIKYWINSNTYLWSHKITPYNWGDYINLILAELISGRKALPYKYASAKQSIAMVGSILPWAIEPDTIVWGSGCLNSRDELWNHIQKPKQVLAVRGPLTRKVLMDHGIYCPEIYGDPALLFPRYYQPKVEKQYKYGVILHASTSLTGSIVSHFHTLLGDSVLFIDPIMFNKWNEFIDKILSCEYILSSSLHGIIIADAYKIPNLWISLTNNEHPDNNFKFKDYYLSIGKTIDTPLLVTDIQLSQIHNELDNWSAMRIDLDKLLSVCPLI